VLGADYAVAIPAGIAIDEISQASVAFSYTVTPAGVEKPVIRVDKKSEKLEAGWVDGVATVVATQPLSTGMKIDCATPGATIQYAMNTATRDYVTILAGNPLKPKPTALGNPTMPLAASITNGHTQGNEIMLGDATNADRGYKYAIAARASDGVVYSQIAYETAFRSVLLFYNDGNIIGRRTRTMMLQGSRWSTCAAATPCPARRSPRTSRSLGPRGLYRGADDDERRG
jgi:hypothetical protein